MLRVTDVLKAAGLIDPTWFTQEARDRGQAVHLATELHDQGELDESQPWGDAKAVKRFQTYQRFRREKNCNIIAVEHEITHPLGFAGRMDRLVEMDSRRGVLDIKPPGESAWHPIQLAAYQAGAGPEWPCRWNLYLGETSYRLVERKNPHDWNVFKAALILAQFKESTCRK